jgi:hypothetical protein
MDKHSSKPVGYRHPYCQDMAIKSGGIAVSKGIAGTGSLGSTVLAGGKNASITITGTSVVVAGISAPGLIECTTHGLSYVTADMSGVVDLVAHLYGTGEITDAPLIIIAGMEADLTGTGELESDISALVNIYAVITASGEIYEAGLAAGMYIEADLDGSGSVTDADLIGAGMISSDIFIGAQPSAEEIAGLVWDQLMTRHSIPGSFGVAMAAAGSAGDPWVTELPGSYPEGSAGDILSKKLLRLSQFLALKD